MFLSPLKCRKGQRVSCLLCEIEVILRHGDVRMYCHQEFRPSLRQDCGIITLLLKGVSGDETKTKKLYPEFKTEVVLEALMGESSQTELCRRHNIYVSLLMDVFTRVIRVWHISQHLTQSLTLKSL